MELRKLDYSRNRIQIAAVAAGLALVLSGCFARPADVSPAQPAGQQFDPTSSMLNVLESHAKRLVGGINQAIINGEFLRSLELSNPPEPILFDNEQEIHQGLNYLLSGRVAADDSGKVFTYRVDSRFCTEIVAKNNPATCVEATRRVSFTQTVSSETSGSLEIRFSSHHPFTVTYGNDKVEVTARLNEVRKAAWEIDEIRVQMGEIQRAEGPSVLTGEIKVTLTAESATRESVSLSALTAVRLEGTDHDGGDYSAQIPAAQNVASVMLDSAGSGASLTVQIPAFDVAFPVNGDDSARHQVEIHFPGLSGALSLNNAARALAAQNVQLGGIGRFDVDGQLALDVTASGPLNGSVSPLGGGEVSIRIANSFGAQANVYGGAGVIDKSGTLNLQIEADTVARTIAQGDQVKVTQGRVQLSGTGDFLGSMDAQAVACIQGSNTGLFLQTAACMQ